MKKLLLSILCISNLVNTNTYSINGFSNQEWHNLAQLMQKWHKLGKKYADKDKGLRFLRPNRWFHEESPILLKECVKEDLKKLATLLPNVSEYNQELSSILEETKTHVSNTLLTSLIQCCGISIIGLLGHLLLPCTTVYESLSDVDTSLWVVSTCSYFMLTVISLWLSAKLQQEKTSLKDFINFVKEEEQKLFGQKDTLSNAA